MIRDYLSPETETLSLLLESFPPYTRTALALEGVSALVAQVVLGRDRKRRRPLANRVAAVREVAAVRSLQDSLANLTPLLGGVRSPREREREREKTLPARAAEEAT